MSADVVNTKTNTMASRNLTNKNDEYYIEVDNLYKFYGKAHAVDGISLKIEKGEIFAFLGPNGTGKTTTVEILETIRTPSKGTINVMGMDVAKNINEVKKLIGVLPQEFSSFDKLNVRESIEFYAHYNNN